MTICGRCNIEIKSSEGSRQSMHYGEIHDKCHDKMIADLSGIGDAK